jgi:hypothetical protein
MTPTAGGRLAEREEGERRESRRMGWLGRGRKKMKQLLGWATRWRGRREKRKIEWVGPKEKKMEKKKCI